MKSFTVAKSILRRIGRDPRTLILVVVTPLLFVLLFGYTFSGSPQSLRVLVINQDLGKVSVQTKEFGRITIDMEIAAEIVQALDSQALNVVPSSSEGAAAGEVKAGRAAAALVFSQGFSHSVVNEAVKLGSLQTIDYQGRTLHLVPAETPTAPAAALVFDDSQPPVADALLRALNQAFAQTLGKRQASLTPEQLLQIEPTYGGGVRMLDYSAPGIIGFAITLITIMLTSVAIVRERIGGTLERLMATPIHPWEITIGFTMAYGLIALLQAAELLSIAYWLFGMRWAGSIGMVAFVFLLYTALLQGLSTLVSTLARNEAQAMQFVLIILIPGILLAGVFWPVEFIPAAIRPLAWAIPLTYLNEALRDILIRGWTLAHLGTEVGILAAFAAFVLALSILAMKREAYSR